MPKQVLPTYSICTLTDKPLIPSDFLADSLTNYLDTHKDLRFPHKHDFYHLIYFASGSGSHSIDFIHFPVEAGQLYFMIPGQVHAWHFKEQPSGFIVNFSAQYINSLISNPRYLDQFSFFSGMANEQVINLPIEVRVQVAETLTTIITEGNSTLEMRDDFVRAALIQLFIQVNRNITRNEDKRSNSYNYLLFCNFQKLIDVHYKEKRLTKDYASMLYVTPNHLNALSNDVTGRSAGELIRDRVLLEAKRLLINAQLSITEIAGELDFADNSYFSKFFKKYTGVSPEIFRTQNI